MSEIIEDFYRTTSIIDLIYLILTIISLIKCYKRGFVLSILSLTKWLVAYIITLFLFPKIQPHVKHIIDNEYVLNFILGIIIFIFAIFFVLFVNKLIRKTVRFIGFGRLDTFLGFFFGFIRAYVVSVCIFSAIDIVYYYDKLPINYNKSYVFPYLKKGSNYLIKIFPNEKTYQDTKEKIKQI